MQRQSLLKDLKLEKEIDLHRLARNFSGLEDLVSKLNRKTGSSNGSVLGFLVLAEAAFEYPLTAYDLDQFLPCLDGNTLLVVEPFQGLENEKALNYLNSALGLSSAEKIYLAQAHVLLAHQELISSGISAKGPAKRLNAVDTLALEDAAKEVNSYGPIALIMYYTLQAWAHFQQKEKAIAFIEKGFNFLASLHVQKETESLAIWAESCIYTAVLLLEKSNPEKALTICNFYFNSRIFQSNSEFKPKDALKATSILYHYISILFNQLDSVPLLSGIPKFSTEHFSQSSPSQQSILKDLRKWLPVYEKYATQAYPFPEGENLSKIGYERHQRVLKVFEWWVQLELFPCWSAQLGEGKAINEYIDRHYSVLEKLYRGTTHSFHALKLFRYISHTFFSLLTVSPYNVCLDEIEEAKKAVESYVFHWEKHFTLLLDVKKKEQMDRLEKDRKVSPKSKESVLPRFKSHRITGNITQYTDNHPFSLTLDFVQDTSPASVSPRSLEGKSPISPASFRERALSYARPSSIGRKLTDEELPIIGVVIEKVDGESVADVVGVLITGMRLLLLKYEGNLELLRLAAKYGEKAFIILSEHGIYLEESNYSAMLAQIFQWLGIVYGELSLEVVSRQDRTVHQDEAIIMLSKARNLQKGNDSIRYQLALQLAQVGDFQQAIDEINKGITLNPNVPVYYNLLALMLSSKNLFGQALELANAGWTQCIQYLLEINNLEGEDQISWDLIDPVFREELINLRLTTISLELKTKGPKGVIDTLKTTFSLLKRIVGAVETQKEDVLASLPLNKNSRQSFKHPSRYSLSSGVHRLGVYELQISLWLTASSVYRELGQADIALNAVEEAEKVLLLFSQTQHYVRHHDSRLFKDEGASAPPSGGYWKDSDPVLARYQADIALEKAFIEYYTYKAQTKPKPPVPYLKYLSPLARVENERQAMVRREQRTFPRFGSSASVNASFDSISISQNLLSDQSIAALSSQLDNMGQKNTHTALSMLPEYPPLEQDPNKIITLEKVISSTQFALLFDLQHLPARTFLGILFKEKGDLGQSEHHLQRACTQQKHRGSSSGLTGKSSIFGGVSSQWGWLSWNQLAIALSELGRHSDAHKAALFALQLERVACSRGYECLPRFPY